jgi:hypothetical protein
MNSKSKSSTSSNVKFNLKSGVVNSVWISSWISKSNPRTTMQQTIYGMPTAIYETPPTPTTINPMPNHAESVNMTNDKDNKESTR